MTKYQRRHLRILPLFLVLSLVCTSCGSQARATTMSLARTQGTVEIRNEDGKDIKLQENMKLYSGYDLETERKSYAWINLDDVKLAKLDVKSEAVVVQDGSALEIDLKSGSLFFNITEPLGEEESLTIRISDMAVGIRGTCGWVEFTDERHIKVYILEGTVECSVTDESGKVTVISVSAGEKAELSLNKHDEEEIIVSPFAATEVPEFVAQELEEDEVLAMEILEASGLDVLNPPALAALDALAGLPYYGDLSLCAMTVDQAAAYARILEEMVQECETAVWDDWYASRYPKPKFCRAALFDAGDGIPALWVVGGYDMEMDLSTLDYLGEWADLYPYISRIYQWDGSQAVLAMDILPDNGYSAVTDQGLMLLYQTDFNLNTVSPAGELYTISAGRISPEPVHTLESVLIEQENAPTLEELRAFVSVHGNPERGYDYSAFSPDMWQDWGMGMSAWHIFALDGVFMRDEDVSTAWKTLAGLAFWGNIQDYQGGTYGEFGFGPYGAQDHFCHWQGGWKDCAETAALLRNAAQ